LSALKAPAILPYALIAQHAHDNMLMIMNMGDLLHTQAPDDDLALQRLMSLTRNKSEDVFAAFTQQQVDAAAAAAGGDGQSAFRRVSLYGCCCALMHQLSCFPVSTHRGFWICSLVLEIAQCVGDWQV
jgi:hypothetical protein